MLKRFRVERKILQGLDKNGINDSKLVFFQTLPMIKMQLQTRQDLVEDRDDHFWSHFVQLKQRDLQNPSVSDTDRSGARLWLDMHNTIQSGGSIQGDDLTWYLELFQKQWRRVFNETKETLIVVTTANNGHLLRSKAIKWKPDLAIVDEAASGLEADSLILLTLGAERIVLVGDNDQLKPLVFTINQCEYYLQLGLSVFQRLVEGGHPRFQLNVNYRMHQRIAMFPGMVTYTWLGCGDKTWEETVDFKLVSEWWNSPAARPIRLLRRNPWASSGLKTSSDCRRLLFNTTGSRSAPLPGRKSLRNFGNVNAMVEILDMLLAHRGADGISRFNGQSITIITGYRDQQDELKKQFGVRIVNWEELGSYMDTIDAMQGGENDIIFLELTTANEFHGSKIGFLKEWPRMNVALTRAKSVLWMFGNWEKWVEEIHMLAKENTTNKFALLMADLLELGDIVDIFRFNNKGEPDPRALRLPATRDEIERSPEMWSREIEHGNRNDIVWKNNDTARHAVWRRSA
ncbi:AAA domain-containing protein [Rhexocercosporidium sp. MPI-PUGE-AT-0058]|nr:AAA domain-containing protein [Rhexocercosporidium sp. MPI-PUGE-AT-0058]